MRRALARTLIRLAESLALAGLMVLAFRFPAASGYGYLEAIAALLFPAALLRCVFRGRHLGWSFLAFALGLVGIFYWVPATLATRAPMPYPAALGSALLFYVWEALGFLAVAFLARWAYRRRGAWGAALGAALGILIWEAQGFHIYTWSWGAALGGLPWLARSAAFLTTHGLAAAFWGVGALMAASAAHRQYRRLWVAPLALLAALLGLSLAWHLLPRGPERMLDVVMIQPNFEPGHRDPWMEPEMWARSDRVMQMAGLPRRDAATLLLWPESSVLGRDDCGPDPRLTFEARHRGIAWLFGTEGGVSGSRQTGEAGQTSQDRLPRYLLLNLVRGEAANQPSFIQAKVTPMPFGERMPGPAWLRTWLDEQLGFMSQEPGQLTPNSTFRFPTPQGPLAVHPVLCSEALDCRRVQRGLALAGGDLLTSHTNDGWFERSIATDLHGAQIRLRSVEAGLPLLRVTLTGKSGVFREDGTWSLWGEPRSEGSYVFSLRWRPIRTPARQPGLVLLLELLLGAGLLALVAPSFRKPAP